MPFLSIDDRVLGYIVSGDGISIDDKKNTNYC